MKHLFKILIPVIFLLSCNNDDGATIEPPPTTIEEAIPYFAPLVKFHTNERYFPSTVESFIQGSALYYAEDGQFPTEDQSELITIYEIGELTSQLLVNATITDVDGIDISSSTDDSRTRSDFFVSPTTDPNQILSPVFDGNLSEAKCYVNVVRPLENESYVDIQYHFFYPYNGPANNFFANIIVDVEHEGDWENITVRCSISTNGEWEVQNVFYSAHGSDWSKWYQIDEVLWEDEHHPIVFSALHTHANYPQQSGLPDNFQTTCNGVDYFNIDEISDGINWETWNHLEIVRINTKKSQTSSTAEIPEIEEISSVAWQNFNGNWGSDGPHGSWLRENSPWFGGPNGVRCE